MKSLLIALVTIALLPAFGHAQERVAVDINYVGGGFTSAFDYPKEVTLSSGKTYDTNGIGVAAKVAVTDIVSVGGRYERTAPRNAQFFEGGGKRGIVGRQTEPDQQATDGIVGYWEISGSFKLHKTHGHSLTVGLAKANIDRGFFSDSIYSLHASHTGLVVGGEGSQRLGNVMFDYAGRVYPRMVRKDYESWSAMTLSSPDSRSFGCELRGSATWTIAKHVGLTGGYEFRRLRTETPDSFWPINENQTTKAVVVGTRFSF